MLQRISLFDLNFISAPDCRQVVDDLMPRANSRWDDRNGLPLLITPNVDDVVKFSKQQHWPVAQQMKKAAYILPDGQFVVWASWLMGKPLRKRLPGSDLFPVLWDAIKAQHKRVLLIAPNEEVGRRLQLEHAGLTYYVPPFYSESDPVQCKLILEMAVSRMESVCPDIVLIGIRFPKQHLLALGMYGHLQKKPAASASDRYMPMFMLLGASFEFYLGIKKRAPRFVRFMGLEWFHRFLQEPRRLYKRFFIEDLAFFPIVWREMLKRHN